MPAPQSIHLSHERVAVIEKALQEGDDGMIRDVLRQALTEQHTDAQNHVDAVQIAREDYAVPSDNNIEIDDHPVVVPTKDGHAWVNAWLYVEV